METVHRLGLFKAGAAALGIHFQTCKYRINRLELLYAEVFHRHGGNKRNPKYLTELGTALLAAWREREGVR